jgi:hypothetical protein
LTRKGKPGESRGRKALGLKLKSYDRQAAESRFLFIREYFFSADLAKSQVFLFGRALYQMNISRV